MKSLFAVVILLFINLLSLQGQSKQLPILSSDSVLSITQTKADSNTTIIINFWATWCKPCVEELPYFVQADTSLKDSNYHFYFISFDENSKVNAVSKFVERMKLQGYNALISVDNMNKFISAVDESWSGGIPLTIVITQQGKKFHEGSFENYKQLWHYIRD